MHLGIATATASCVFGILFMLLSSDVSKALDQTSREAMDACRQHADARGNSYDPDRALDECKHAAEEDMASAGEIVCKIYGRKGSPEDLAHAAEWCLRAGTAGNSWAQFQEANMLFDGLGVARNPTEALLWMRKAADQGHELAKRDLADIESANELDQGDRARRFLDVALRYVTNDPPNQIAAFRWMHRAADLGNPIAQLNFANMLLAGYGMDAPQPAMSIPYFQNAADQGNVDAMFKLGVVYANGEAGEPNRAEGIRLVTAAAERSHPAAMFELGELLISGNGVKQDVGAGIAYIERSAQAAYPEAQFILGLQLLSGDVIKRDVTGGVELLTKAADAGLVQAQAVLGQLLYNGESIPPDQEKARTLLGLAATAGSADAMLALAKIELAPGGGGAQASREWYLRAARRMDPRAFIALAEGSSDGSLGEVSGFQAYSWAAAAVGIYPGNKEYDRALKLRNELGAKLTVKERLDASILALKRLMEMFPSKYDPG